MWCNTLVAGKPSATNVTGAERWLKVTRRWVQFGWFGDWKWVQFGGSAVDQRITWMFAPRWVMDAMLNTVQCWTECNVEHRVQRSVQQIRRMFAPQWVALMACCDPQFVRQAHCQCLNQLIAQAQAQAQAHCQCLNLHHLDCQATTPMILDSSSLPSCCSQHTAIAMPVQVVPQPPNICLSSIDGQVSSAPRILQSSSCHGCQKLEASHTANSWDNIPAFDIAPE